MPLPQLDINNKRPERSLSSGSRHWTFLPQGSHHPRRQTSSATQAAESDLNDRHKTHSGKRPELDEPGAAQAKSKGGSTSSSRRRQRPTESRKRESRQEATDKGTPEFRSADCCFEVCGTPNGCGRNNNVRRVSLWSLVKKYNFRRRCIAGYVCSKYIISRVPDIHAYMVAQYGVCPRRELRNMAGCVPSTFHQIPGIQSFFDVGAHFATDCNRGI